MFALTHLSSSLSASAGARTRSNDLVTETVKVRHLGRPYQKLYAACKFRFSQLNDIGSETLTAARWPRKRRLRRRADAYLSAAAALQKRPAARPAWRMVL